MTVQWKHATESDLEIIGDTGFHPVAKQQTSSSIYCAQTESKHSGA